MLDTVVTRAGFLSNALAVLALPHQTEPPPHPQSLAAVLVNLPARKGELPLLIVDAKSVFPNAAPKHTGQKYTLPELAALFDRKIIRTNTLWALAPTKMTVLNSRLAAPNFALNLSPDEAFHRLQATFTRAQWAILGGDGIGLGDLNNEQRDLFVRMLPDPFRVTRGKITPQGNVQYGGDDGAKERPGDELTADRRLGVRFRLSRKSRLIYINKQGNSFSSYMGEEKEPDANGEIMEIMGMANPRDGSGTSAYGQPVLRELPNTPKPTQLDLSVNTLNISVTLADADTVGELVRRVAKTSGMEIYCDPRLARLSLWTRGEAARACDILRVLCAATTSTFRKLGAAHVMTDDIEGIGARKAIIGEWATRAGIAIRQEQEARQKKIRAQNPLPLLGYAPSDPLANNTELQKRVAAGITPYAFVAGVDMAKSELPPALQERLERRVKSGEENPGMAIQAEKVRVGTSLSREWIVPGIGAVPDTRFRGQEQVRDEMVEMLPEDTKFEIPPEFKRIFTPVPPLSLSPTRFATRTLIITPKAEDDVKEAARAARRYGFNTLWIVADEGTPAQRITDAFTVGKTAKLAVGVVVRLLNPPAGESNAAAEINILRETSAQWATRRDAAGLQRYSDFRSVDFIRPDRIWLRTVALQRRMRWLQTLAQTSGLSALVLRDTAPPGCAGLPEPGQEMRDGRTDFGYDETTRLACLRAHDIDPIDIDQAYTSVAGVTLQLPFFNDTPPTGGTRPNDSRTLRRKWNGLRRDRNAQWIASLHGFLRQSVRGGTTIFLRDRLEPTNEGDTRGGWYGSWDKPEALPRVPKEVEGMPTLAVARKTSQRVFVNVSALPDDWLGDLPPNYKPDVVQDFARFLKYRLDRDKNDKWDGITVDISELPLADGLKLLAAFVPVGTAG